MRKILDQLHGIVSQAQASSDQNDFNKLSKDLNKIGIEVATLGYDSGSTYQQFAPIQMAYDAACRAVEAMCRRD
jgi:hypothetical protein